MFQYIFLFVNSRYIFINGESFYPLRYCVGFITSPHSQRYPYVCCMICMYIYICVCVILIVNIFVYNNLYFFPAEYVLAYKIDPFNPMYSLLIGVICAHLASQKYTVNKQQLVLQVEMNLKVKLSLIIVRIYVIKTSTICCKQQCYQNIVIFMF